METDFASNETVPFYLGLRLTLGQCEEFLTFFVHTGELHADAPPVLRECAKELEWGVGHPRTLGDARDYVRVLSLASQVAEKEVDNTQELEAWLAELAVCLRRIADSKLPADSPNVEMSLSRVSRLRERTRYLEN